VTPLVLVHGFLGGSAQWEKQTEALRDQCDALPLDLPGFGCNAHLQPCDTIGGFADWVLDTLHRRGITRFNLLGHSMGGMIAQEMAARAPEQIDKLILYATGAIGVLPGRFETIAESKMRAQAEGAQATARRISATWFLQGSASPAYEDCAEIAQSAGMDAILCGLEAMQTWSGEDALDQLTCETLVLWGDRDRTYPWSQIEKLWQTIPNTSLAVIPNTAHAVHLENPAQFNAVLQRFIGQNAGD